MNAVKLLFGDWIGFEAKMEKTNAEFASGKNKLRSVLDVFKMKVMPELEEMMSYWPYQTAATEEIIKRLKTLKDMTGKLWRREFALNHKMAM